MDDALPMDEEFEVKLRMDWDFDISDVGLGLVDCMLVSRVFHSLWRDWDSDAPLLLLTRPIDE